MNSNNTRRVYVINGSPCVEVKFHQNYNNSQMMSKMFKSGTMMMNLRTGYVFCYKGLLEDSFLYDFTELKPAPEDERMANLEARIERLENKVARRNIVALYQGIKDGTI